MCNDIGFCAAVKRGEMCPNEETTMDPNETLKNLRYTSERISETSDPDTIAALAADMMLYFDSLDGWLSRGGFLPDEWMRNRDRSVDTFPR